MEFDKWDLLQLNMPWRLESFTILSFESEDDERVMIVGGVTENQVPNDRLYIVDLTIDLRRVHHHEQFNIGKIYEESH